MKIKRKTVLLVLLMLCLTDRGSAQTIVPSVKDIAKSQYWHLLLHYRNNRSEVSTPGFFFSPVGATDSQAELEATLTAFAAAPDFSVGFFGQHPQCAYPERFRFLREHLKLTTKIVDCPELKEWKSRVAATSVTMVYAAPDLSQAASMFGHTFLRINSTGNELLSQGISFDATSGPINPFSYIFKGLFGGFPGVFSQAPYYEKVKTYNQRERRDLWEYELNLTAEQIDHFLNHLWEMQNAAFDYYFTNGNCSYHLLSLLEVANPQWELRRQFQLAALPLDTVRAVTRYSDSVKSVHARPALNRELLFQVQQLSSEDRSTFKKLSSNPGALTGMESAALLDALLDWRKMQIPQDPEVDRKIILARARAGPLQPKAMNLATRPDEGHSSGKVMLLTGSRNEKTTVGLEFRPLLHDLLDADTGYNPFSALVIGETAIEYQPSGAKFSLKRIILAEVINLVPLNPVEQKASWVLGARVQRPDVQDCDQCVIGQLHGGAGVSAHIISDRVLWYSLIKVQLEFSNPEPRYGPSIALGFISSFSKLWKAQLSTERLFYFPKSFPSDNDYSKISAGLAFSHLPIEIRAGGELMILEKKQNLNSVLGLGWYF